MTTTTPTFPVEQPLKGKAAVKAVRKAFSSPIASAVIILISVLWTIPTLVCSSTPSGPSRTR